MKRQTSKAALLLGLGSTAIYALAYLMTGILLRERFPHPVGIHWGLDGRVDGFGPLWGSLLVGTAVIVGLTGFMSLTAAGIVPKGSASGGNLGGARAGNPRGARRHNGGGSPGGVTGGATGGARVGNGREKRGGLRGGNSVLLGVGIAAGGFVTSLLLAGLLGQLDRADAAGATLDLPVLIGGTAAAVLWGSLCARLCRRVSSAAPR